MKKISKSLITCIVSIFLLVFAAVPAFADNLGIDQTAMDNYIQTILPELTSIEEDTAADTIAYYNENGYPGIAEGFQSWIDLKSGAGEYQSVGTCTFIENEDGTIEITAPVVCTNGTISIRVLLDQSGYVTSFLFSKGSVSAEGSLGSKMKEATVNLVVGMGTVFAVLIFLCWVISLFRNIGKIEKKIADRKAAKSVAVSAAPEAEPSQPAAAVTSAPAASDELEAVIAAAIAAYEADNGSIIEKQPALGNGIIIKTYRRN